MIAQRIAAIAQAQVGVLEEGGANRGATVVQYQRATWLTPGPWPWCAAFTAWVLREWLRAPDVRALYRLHNDVQAERWRCRDARAYAWEQWARDRSLLVLGENAPAMAGDFVTFDFSHIGIVVGDHGSHVLTVEGNTNTEGSREGDGVYARRRARGLIRHLIRVTDA